MNKSVVSLVFLTLTAALEGCSPSRTPVVQLPYESLEKVALDCKATGKIAADDYCKEAAVVYGEKSFKKNEEERLARVKAEAATMATDLKVPSF